MPIKFISRTHKKPRLSIFEYLKYHDCYYLYTLAMKIDGFLLMEPVCYTVQLEMHYDLSFLLFSKYLAELIYVHYNWTTNSCGSLMTSSIVYIVLIYSPSCHSVSCQNSKPTGPFVLHYII